MIDMLSVETEALFIKPGPDIAEVGLGSGIVRIFRDVGQLLIVYFLELLYLLTQLRA